MFLLVYIHTYIYIIIFVFPFQPAISCIGRACERADKQIMYEYVYANIWAAYIKIIANSSRMHKWWNENKDENNKQ